MKRIFLIPILTYASHVAVCAQDNASANGLLYSRIDSICRQFDLGELVVTGTRTPKFLKDTPIQTRVITSRDIARVDATDIKDLLQQELPGIEFSYAMNQQTHLNFSGFGGQGVLFLVDEIGRASCRERVLRLV